MVQNMHSVVDQDQTYPVMVQNLRRLVDQGQTCGVTVQNVCSVVNERKTYRVKVLLCMHCDQCPSSWSVRNYPITNLVSLFRSTFFNKTNIREFKNHIFISDVKYRPFLTIVLKYKVSIISVWSMRQYLHQVTRHYHMTGAIFTSQPEVHLTRQIRVTWCVRSGFTIQVCSQVPLHLR